MASTPSATAGPSSSSSLPTQYRAVGIALAIGSGVLIGGSFVLKKKGLLRSQQGHTAGEGVAYLKSVMWWSGMIMMICGELCNFGAYAFVEAIVVTPLGALSVVISAILSHTILKESLNLFGWIGCIQCILGAVLIALNAPSEQSVSTIEEFKHLFLAPGFLSYGAVCIAVSGAIIFYFAPKYGKNSMLWYISVCSLIGGLSVSCTQGLGACIVTSIRGDNQFKNWFTYFLLVFVACTLCQLLWPAHGYNLLTALTVVTEIFYLNVALALFNTAMVTPTYYVMFTFCTLVTSVILYQGLKASAGQIMTIVLAFFVICTGIFVLQMSKTDPRKLTKLDRQASNLLEAARATEVKPQGSEDRDMEKDEDLLIESTEEPGMDAVVGRFGGVGGSIVRARRRATIKSIRSGRSRAETSASALSIGSSPSHTREHIGGGNPPPLPNGLARAPDSTDSTPTSANFLSSNENISPYPQPGTPNGDLGRNPSVRFVRPGDDRTHNRTTSARSASILRPTSADANAGRQPPSVTANVGNTYHPSPNLAPSDSPNSQSFPGLPLASQNTTPSSAPVDFPTIPNGTDVK